MNTLNYELYFQEQVKHGLDPVTFKEYKINLEEQINI